VTLAAVCLVVAGAALVAVGVLRRRRVDRVQLAMAIGLSGPGDAGERDLAPIELARVRELWRPEGETDSHRSLVARVGGLRRELALGGAGALAIWSIVTVLTGRPALGLIAIVAASVAVVSAARRRRRRHQQRIAEQFPDALLLLAAALQAGNPLPRALRTLAERGTQPLAGELALVVSETELGLATIDALDAMAERVDVDDVRWFARAVRIQQSVGGQLGPIIRSVADVMAARAEVQREARVLTAEGRASAWVLGALPVLLTVACEVTNPEYLDPMFRGGGLFVLVACGASVALGITCILRMVDGEVGR
jgi:tight adherence protein B